MSRIDELQQKYPSIPRDVILKHDAMVQGIRDDEDIEKVSDWRPAKQLYQSHDYDVTLEDLAKKRPGRVKQGYMLRLDTMCFKSGLATRVRLRSTSPYAIREVSEGKFSLYQGEEEVEDIYFPRPKPRTGPEPLTSKGTPISRLIDLKRRCFVITPVRHCEYFSLGEQCKFCNLNPSYEDAGSVGLNPLTTIDLQDTVEAYKIRYAEVGPLLEGVFCMGGFMKAEHEARIYLDFVEKIAGAASPKPNLTLATQAMHMNDMQRLKDAGLDACTIQLEVMDPQMFPEICPGKAKHMPYDGWLECIQNAVDVYGVGNVAVKLIPGITLFAPSGHKTWQEARDYHIEANRWIIKNGALPAFVAMWWAPGSALSEQDASYVDKFPPTEYLLDVARAHHEAMLESGLYDKMNKFMYCALDHIQGNYAGEIGMITLAGDLGNWMADVVPYEANWLAQFIESLRLQTQ